MRGAVAILVLVAAASTMIVDLWEHRDAPPIVKLALVAGTWSIALLALVAGVYARRRL